MRKFASFAGLVCIAVLLAGCSARVAVLKTESIVTTDFKDKTGEIAVMPISIPDARLPVIFGVSFEKTGGNLELTITDPEGKEVFKDTVQANDAGIHKKEVPEPLRYDWGYYSFNKVMDLKGEYKVAISGNGSTGSIQFNPIPSNKTYFSDFTGTAVRVAIEVSDTSKEIGFNLQALPVQGSTGVIMAKIYDPEGIEIRSTRLTYDQNNENLSMLDFWDKPAKTGTYTATIEAKNASGSAQGDAFFEKPIGLTAFAKPVLFILLGLALFFMIKQKDRKVMVWGGMLWLIATFVISILFGVVLNNAISNLFTGPYAGLTLGFINTVTLSVAYVLIVWFGRFVTEVKNASPTELVAFVFGFAFVSPLLTGLSDLMQISNANGTRFPNVSEMVVPGYYPSGAFATVDIASSFITYVCMVLSTIAALIVFLWVVRQRENVARATLWLAALGAIGIKIVADASLLYFKQSVVLAMLDKPVVGFRLTFGLASPVTEAAISAAILIVMGVLVVVNWKRIMGLALKACPVTIDDFAKKEEK